MNSELLSGFRCSLVEEAIFEGFEACSDSAQCSDSLDSATANLDAFSGVEDIACSEQRESVQTDDYWKDTGHPKIAVLAWNHADVADGRLVMVAGEVEIGIVERSEC